MNKSILIAIYFLYTEIIIGQPTVPTHQIILKLKTEAYSPGFSLCKKDKLGNKKLESINKKYKALKVKRQSTGKKSNQFIFIIQFPYGVNLDEVIEEYYKTGDIEYAEPDFKGSGSGTPDFKPNDNYYFRQWNLQNNGTFFLSPSIAGADIDMEKAWELEQGDSNIVVAIIDSGVRLVHPEFTGRIWTNYNEISNNGIDDDNNGYADDTRGWDFANNDNNPSDDYGHGSNVTGIIGANGNNSIGYAGVDWHCKLMILKGLDANNSGYYSWWIFAIYYAVDQGANVINMSLVGQNHSVALEEAVHFAVDNNVIVVVSMGNDNTNRASYPAAYSGVIAVGSTNSNDKRTNPFFWSPTSGSNFGNHISVVAPGNFIYGLDYRSNTDYGYYWGGTSQAAPLVSGLAALLLAQNSNRTPAQIKSIIESTAEDLVGDPFEDKPGWDRYYGYGRINAYNALSLITNTFLSNPLHELSLFPNPCAGNFYIQSPVFPLMVSMYNEKGVLESTYNVNSSLIQINEKKIAGLYILKIESDHSQVIKKLFIQ